MRETVLTSVFHEIKRTAEDLEAQGGLGGNFSLFFRNLARPGEFVISPINRQQDGTSTDRLMRGCSMALVVTYLISTLADGGPVNVLWGIVRHLDQRNFRPVIVTLSPEPEKSSITRFRSAGIEVRQLQIPRIASLWAGKRIVRDTIADTNADLVHCHGFRATLLAAAGCSQRFLVATLHCDIEEDYRLTYGRIQGKLMASMEYYALRRFAFVAAVGQSIDNAARRCGIQSSVLTNGIDLDTYFPPRGQGEIRSIRARLGWSAGEVIILHTGVLSVRKRPIEVIEDFLAASSKSNAILVFAGDGPLRERCIQAARNSSRIFFLGRRADVPELLRAADILISNSESEGLPLALLEGCATGMRVLATDIQPHREIQKLFPQQVLLFRNRPQAMLRSTIKQMTDESYVRPTPPGESLENISDRRMSYSYQLAYRSLIA